MDLVERRQLEAALAIYASEQDLMYRKPDGTDISAASIPSRNFGRFIVARNNDFDAACEMFVQHLEWRKNTFPIERTEKLQAALDSGRFNIVGTDSHERPVIAVNFMWGKFAQDDLNEDDLLKAYVIFLEEKVLLPVEEATGDEELIYIFAGGPPSTGLLRNLEACASLNFPERLRMALVAYVPFSVAAVVNGLLWFLPSRTRDKFRLIDTEASSMCMHVVCMVCVVRGFERHTPSLMHACTLRSAHFQSAASPS